MKKIFLVDDDIDDRDSFRTALQALHTKVDYIEAVDGQDALDMMEHDDFVAPDVFFVDLNMPRVTGLEFIIKIKLLARYQNIPTYIYTTSTSPQQKINCIAAGATGYIIKHVKQADLTKELSHVIAKLDLDQPVQFKTDC